MVRQTRFDVEFEPALDLAARLQAVGGGALRRAQVEAVNEVTSRFDLLARKGENEGINLSDAYIAEKTRVTLAANGVPSASIVTRGDLTPMGRFPHSQMWKPAKGKAKGDPKRGIPAGSKAAGVRVDIAKGRPQYSPSLFTMTLREGARAGTRVGVFVRTSAGRLKHLYGPSPYSLFRYQVERRRDDLLDDLENTGLERMLAAATEALG